MNVGKCFACRTCSNLNEDKSCKQGRNEGADKPDECWLYQNKYEQKGLATHSSVDSTWN